MLKRILLGVAIVGGVMQFFRPEKNISPTPPDKDDLLVALAAPANVKQMLQVACYDCHSSTTRYPWYAEIQPLGWWLRRHIDDGKLEFNFSAFGTYSAKRQKAKLETMADVVKDRSMPLKSYTIIHRDAIFDDAQVAKITKWLEAAQEKLDEEK